MRETLPVCSRISGRSCRSGHASSRDCLYWSGEAEPAFLAHLFDADDRAIGSLHRIGKDDLGAERLQDPFPLRSHVLGHAESDAVSSRGADHRVGDPGVPDVASRMILSRVRAPERSPSAIIRAAARSLTDPPGFFHSALAYSSTLRSPASNSDRRISGVFPIKSTTDEACAGTLGRRRAYPTASVRNYNSPQSVLCG